MNIGGGQIRGAFFNFFVVKKCPFLYLLDVDSVSKITPAHFISICFFKLGFTPCKAGQPLQGMELQEKETQKD